MRSLKRLRVLLLLMALSFSMGCSYQDMSLQETRKLMGVEKEESLQPDDLRAKTWREAK